jgi:hypothetical protein
VAVCAKGEAVKVKVPAKTVEVCDICKKESSFLTVCTACGKEYCHICEAIHPGCIHQPRICRECDKLEGVSNAIDSFTEPLITLLKRRDAAMKAARINDTL